jgi:hypothetical protein
MHEPRRIPHLLLQFIAENTQSSYGAFDTASIELDMPSDKEKEVERERTSDKGRNVSRAGAGRERATVFKSKTGVAVVEATVARLTGGGKFVVQPIGGQVGVDVGDQVIIFILDKKLLGRGALLETQTEAHT